MTNGLHIYGYLILHFLIYILGSSSSYMTLQPLPSEFPYIWGKCLLLFNQCGVPLIASLAAGTLSGCDWPAGDSLTAVVLRWRYNRNQISHCPHPRLRKDSQDQVVAGPLVDRWSLVRFSAGLPAESLHWEQQMQSRHSSHPLKSVAKNLNLGRGMSVKI